MSTFSVPLGVLAERYESVAENDEVNRGVNENLYVESGIVLAQLD